MASLVFCSQRIVASLAIKLLVGLHEIAHFIGLGHAQAHPVAERRKRPANPDIVFRKARLNFFDVMTSLPGGEWGFLIVSMILIFILGFFLDFLEICFIVVPILTPIAAALGIDLLWLAILIAMNLQTSFLTPPFGFSLFYLKAVAPEGIRIQHIYKGIIPFVLIQLVTILVLIAFPDIVTWLPDLMDRIHGL